MRPRIFVGSSREHLDVAYAAQEGLEHVAEVTVWTQGVFELSKTAVESLLDTLDDMDYGLFVFAPDDILKMRSVEHQAVRDNIIFELGLFVGRLGRERAFILMPKSASELHLPTDLLGINPATYEADRQDGNIVAAVGPACNRIRKAIEKFGLHKAAENPTSVMIEPSATLDNHLMSDPTDCLSMIESWMGSRSAHLNTNIIRFDDVDRELKLLPGSARSLLKKAARRWGYIVIREGKDTIIFEDAPNSYNF